MEYKKKLLVHFASLGLLLFCVVIVATAQTPQQIGLPIQYGRCQRSTTFIG